MDYKQKYLKYKSKYLELQKLYGGAIKYIERPESDIINGFVGLSNKGTQNCGVYINYKDPHKILLCNNSKLSDIQLEFLNLNNESGLKIYPILHQLYHSTDTNKYFYLWEKMDGDLRDFVLKHIPTRILKKYKPDVTEEQIKIFLDFIDSKRYPDKLFINTGECKIYQDKLISNKCDYNPEKYISIGSYIGTDLLYKNTDEESIKYKLNIIKSFDIYLSDINSIRIMADIIKEIENQLYYIIKTLSYKRYLMCKQGFYTSDKKFDNIVYKIIETDGDNYKYDFYFIDPESTLQTIDSGPYAYFTTDKVFEHILYDLQTKYQDFKMTEKFPNIYDTFLTTMFDICDSYNNHPNMYNNLYLNYLEKEVNKGLYPQRKKFINGWEVALQKFNIDKNNIFPLQINTEEEFLQFIKK